MWLYGNLFKYCPNVGHTDCFQFLSVIYFFKCKDYLCSEIFAHISYTSDFFLSLEF